MLISLVDIVFGEIVCGEMPGVYMWTVMLKYQKTRDTIEYLYLPAAHETINSHLPRQSLSELETQCYYGSATRTEVIVALTPRSRQARYHERGDVDCAMMAFADFHHRRRL